MANSIVAVLSVMIAALGFWGVVSPSRLLPFVRRWQSKTGFWFAVAFRLFFGGILWLVAPSSRVPLAIQSLAVATAISGMALPIMGFSRYQKLLSWWSGRSMGFLRAWSSIAVGVGMFLFWSVIG